MQAGGFTERIMAAGAELDRVKEFLLVLSGERDPSPCPPKQAPCVFPVFPGLAKGPFYDGRCDAALAALEESYETILEEARKIESASFLPYPTSTTAPGGEWTVYPMCYMGVDLSMFNSACPETFETVKKLPRSALRYPWADALFSAHTGGTHLTPHTSIDNLRARCHLALEIPDGCEIIVGGEARRWQAGRALCFDESFEHETWNRSDERRVVLIVDVWHPDLTDVEIRALDAGFRKSEVRDTFFEFRLKGQAKAYREFLWDGIVASDQEDSIEEFWNV